jgi:DNA-binding CsgD family transcriptional regulator
LESSINILSFETAVKGGSVTFNKSFDDLIRSVYLVSSGLEKMDLFLDNASAVFNSHLVGCIKTDKFDASTEMPFFRGVTEKDKQNYNEYFADKNVLISVSLRELLGGEVVSSEENFTLDELRRTEFYDGYMRYLDAQYTAGFMFASTPESFYTLVVCRPSPMGAYTKQEKRMLAALRTHAQSAMHINSHLNSLKSAVKVSSHALDRLNMGVCTLGSGLQVLEANEAAKAIFKKGAFLTTQFGRLIGGTLSDLKLAGLLHKISTGTIKSSQQFRLLSGVPGEECLLSIFPVLDAEEFWWIDSNQVKYIIFIGTHMTPSDTSLAFLEKEFALTKRELEVLSKLVQGGTLTSLAREFRVSHETIRTHTKSIFRKMDVHSQAQLAVKVLSLSTVY